MRKRMLGAIYSLRMWLWLSVASALWEKGLWPTAWVYLPTPAKWRVSMKKEWTQNKWLYLIVAVPLFKRGKRYCEYSSSQFLWHTKYVVVDIPPIDSFHKTMGKNCFIFSRTVGTADDDKMWRVLKGWVGELVMMHYPIFSFHPLFEPSFEVLVQ